MRMASHYYSSSIASEKLEEIDEEEQLMWQAEHNMHHDMDDDDSEEDELMIEDASSMSSSPSIPDENINFDLVYALHTFVATVEGQASVVKGDALILMEDTNIYWWLVEVLKTREVGYIPAENIETPYERLARLNKHRNVEITSPSIADSAPQPIQMTHPLKPQRRVTIGDESMSKIFHYEVESEIDEDDEDRLEEDSIHSERGQDTYQDTRQGEFQEMVMDPYDEQARTSQKWQEKNWDEEYPLQNGQQLQAVQPQQALHMPISSASEQQLSTEETLQQKMELRVFAGNIGQGPLFHTFTISIATTADELIRTSVNKFGMIDVEPSEDTTIEYYLAVQGMDGDEYVLSAQDKPFSIFKTLTDSLTTPMPSLSHIKRISQQSLSSLQSRNSTSRRPRSSSFSNYEQTSYDEDSVIRFYLHRRIKRAHEREGLLYIKVSLYPDESAASASAAVIIPSRDNTAFTKNPTPTKSKKRQPAISSRSEIDRIDKIIAVHQESPIGAVINLALEKFHVPDAQADDYPGKNDQLRNSRQLGKYRMSVRGNGQEIELHPNQLMSNVLLQQQSSSPNHSGPITSDLLFVVRKAGSMVKQSQKQRHPPKGSQLSQDRMLPAQLSTAMASEDRRPSILDILMDSTPRMGERRPSVMSSLLEPPPRSTEDANNRRPSGSTANSSNGNQERKSSLNHQIQQQSPSSSSSSSFQNSKSPNSLLGFNRRSSAQSSSVISGSSIDDERNIHPDSTIVMDNTIQVTPTSSSSIMRSQQSTANTEKKKESFKQQFKRFVGWGSSSSSSSSKKQQANQPPPLTTPFSNNNSAIVDPNSPSDISFVSAPSTPLPPTPGTPRSIALPKSRQGSTSHHPLEVSTPISMSRRPSEATTLNDPSAASIAAAAAVSAASKRLSTVSSVSSASSCISSVTSEEIATATSQALAVDEEEEDDDIDSDDNRADTSTAATATSFNEEAASKKLVEVPMSTSLSQPSSENPIEDPSTTDIQTQYAMWMNSQTNISMPEETHVFAAPIPPAKNTSQASMTTKALSPVSTPSRNPLRNKSSTISNAASVSTTTSVPQAISVAATTPAQSNCTTSTPSIASATTTNKIEVEEPLHPMPSNNGQDLDDLFLLVAHGVDFLTTRENTKWEEEGGYEFHPWNRPQSSFAVRQQQQQSHNNCSNDISPLLQGHQQYNEQTMQQKVQINVEEGMKTGNSEAESTSAALSMARSLLLSPAASEENKPMSPPLTPIPQHQAQEDSTNNNVQPPQQQESPSSMAKRILGAKAEVNAPIPQTQQPAPQQHQSVDDEELQRIVASHILF